MKRRLRSWGLKILIHSDLYSGLFLLKFADNKYVTLLQKVQIGKITFQIGTVFIISKTVDNSDSPV